MSFFVVSKILNTISCEKNVVICASHVFVVAANVEPTDGIVTIS